MSVSVNISATLQAAYNVAPSRAEEIAPALERACERWHIDNPRRIGMFLAQLAHESGNFRFGQEIWGPTEAQKRYDTRTDLGNTPERDGDGYRYRGRGFIQLTGKANYKACGDALGIDLVANPEKLVETETAAQAAGWFWSTNNINPPADACDVRRCTRIINGGYNGLSDREKKYDAVMRHLRSDLLPNGKPKPLTQSGTVAGGGLVTVGTVLSQSGDWISDTSKSLATAQDVVTEATETANQAAHLWQDAGALNMLGLGIVALGIVLVFYRRWKDGKRHGYH